MSRITDEPARPICTTLLATRPQRTRRVVLADALVATFFHLSAVGALVTVTQGAGVPFMDQPFVYTLIAAEDARLALGLPAGTPTGDHSARPARKSAGRAPGILSAGLPLLLPDIDRIVPKERTVEEQGAALAYETAASELAEALGAYGAAGARDSSDAAGSFDEVRKRVTFTPYSVPPELLNRGEIARILERRYPKDLTALGVGGSTMLWLLIDKDGIARKALIQSSSGREVFDALAIEVVPYMRFKPARNNGSVTHVWVQLPVRFQVVDVYPFP